MLEKIYLKSMVCVSALKMRIRRVNKAQSKLKIWREGWDTKKKEIWNFKVETNEIEIRKKKQTT